MKKLKYLILLICLVVPFSFSACKNKSKSTLATPTISEINSGTIVFDAVKNAEYYTISINDNEFYVDAYQSNYVEIVDNQIKYDASKIFIIGNSYSVKIRANSFNAYSSAFSETYTYKHSGRISTPVNVKTNATTLTWNVVENASYYIVKIITPNDEVVFDKSGNVLTNDKAETIKIADLTEYSFNSNQFDFGSILTVAGKYKFYVSAVLSDGTTYVQSDFAEKVEYTHTVKLSAPTNGEIYSINNELNLMTAVDENANAISISCGNFERTAKIENNDCITVLSNNLISVNLTKFFETFIINDQIDFDDITQYSFKTQSKHIFDNGAPSYYIDSSYSSAVLFDNTEVLSAPTLSLSYSNTNNCYVAEWTTVNTNLIGEFKVLVFTPAGLKEYKLDSNINSMLLTEEFIAVAIKSVGVGNYLSSKISEMVVNPTYLNSVGDISIQTSDSGNGLTWNEIENAYYFVECGTSYFYLTSNNFEIPAETLSSNNQTISVCAFVAGLKPRCKTLDLTYTETLATPTFSSTQGFVSKKLYELTFTGSENAVGYYVYVKSKDATDYIKIDTFYTTTTIDLSQYIISEGEYTDYSVKVQAVADIHSIYLNSQLSEAISVSHVKVLPKPDFYKINSAIVPITKQVSNGENKYILKFYGIEDAGSYDILINYNKLTVNARTENVTGLYEIDISKYLVSANNYEIQIRSLPKETSFNVAPSEYNVANYTLMKQLPSVENIQVTENENVFTLSFSPVDNAQSYRVRVVRENDSNYIDYLGTLGLSNYFEITEAHDVSKYLQQKGVYYFYVTALAPTEDSYYADSNESSTFARLEKLQSLSTPKDITFENKSASEYLLKWTGDENADYYLVRLTDPNNISYEFKVYGETSTNINNYISIQGTYDVSIYSMVETVGGNSKDFASSAATNATERYLYSKKHDYTRHSVYMYGNLYDFSISSADELKNILWYHYLYEIDINTGLSIMIDRQFIPIEDSDETVQETLREAIVRIASEANNLKIYNFNGDEKWGALVKETTKSDKELFEYVCQKIICAYPEFNVLSKFESNHSTGNDLFNLYYKNALNVPKTENDNTLMKVKTNTDYGNKFEYVDLYLRRSESGLFNIDTKPEMLVTTTEQLLHAVQHGRKPKFVGDSAVAETVYNNAKLVLSAIVTNNMTDLDKVTAIFDWLEYGFDLTYYSDVNNKYYISGSLEKANLETYGMYKHYYLEGIFENISTAKNGDIIIESNLATSQSYSKAFALLCAIEGIDSVVVNGNYNYYDRTTSQDKIVDHAWNKVYLSTTSDQTQKHWYAVDLTFSDNRIYFNDLDSGYGISSHTYFLTLDAVTPVGVPTALTFTDENYIISANYQASRKTPEDSQYAYNYYANSTYSLTSEEIAQTIANYKLSNTNPEDYKIENYLKEYKRDYEYQLYSQSQGLQANSMQSYLLNALIYAEHMADNNESRKSVFEFRYDWSNHEQNFDYSLLTGLIETYANKYQLSLNLKFDSQGDYSIYSIKDNAMQTTTVVFIVEKTA